MWAMTSPVYDRELAIPADISMLAEARDWAAATADAFGMDEPACFQVKLAMSEAVTNAIIHGSASAEDEVEIEASEQAGRWSSRSVTAPPSPTTASQSTGSPRAGAAWRWWR